MKTSEDYDLSTPLDISFYFEELCRNNFDFAECCEIIPGN